ncbi:hypothetical protein P171DRAFT_488556 [Karstenula rhodostoma CBS 690.94]|uniref:Uncharacterized protein n=1 Tax=Karstenula rhodostoma CBS 690.94 TaxID=1392251 RepID=A0A9P4U995_9PLEO|nr:hypothetical protein P171DRAFT_488556 [Karstenula rhodostoma CBS 690.94]
MSFASILTGIALAQSYTRPAHLVDAGYAKHIPTWTNSTVADTKLLNYNNIRDARTPSGPLRFWKPKTPLGCQRGIHNGNRASWAIDYIFFSHPGVPFPLINAST